MCRLIGLKSKLGLVGASAGASNDVDMLEAAATKLGMSEEEFLIKPWTRSSLDPAPLPHQAN